MALEIEYTKSDMGLTVRGAYARINSVTATKMGLSVSVDIYAQAPDSPRFRPLDRAYLGFPLPDQVNGNLIAYVYGLLKTHPQFQDSVDV